MKDMSVRERELYLAHNFRQVTRNNYLNARILLQAETDYSFEGIRCTDDAFVGRHFTGGVLNLVSMCTTDAPITYFERG